MADIPVRDDLDFLLPTEVARILRLKSVKQVYEKPIRKQYEGRRVLYRRSDLILYLASQEPPKPRSRKRR
jgi:hypothetical protein